MTSKSYEYIVAVAQEGNLSRAAKKLGISLPYLSHQMQNIEKEIGVQILTHGVANTSLNDVGQELSRQAYHLFFLQRCMRQRMIDSMGRDTGTLAVGLSAYRSTYTLPSILPQFYRRYRNTHIELKEAGVEQMEPLVVQGKADVAITVQPSDHPNILNRFLGEEDLVLAVPPGYPIADIGGDAPHAQGMYPSLPLRKLGDLPFIYLNAGTSLNEVTRQLMQQEQFVPTSYIESKSLEAIYNLVLEGAGAAILPTTMIESDLFTQRPQCFSIQASGFHRNIYAIYRADGYLSNACRELLSLFEQNLAQCAVPR